MCVPARNLKFETCFQIKPHNKQDNKQQTNNKQMDMMASLPNDIIIKIIREEQRRQIKQAVIDELNDIISKADDYCECNVEDADGWVEWNGERVGNGEWEYSFWSHLE